MSWVGIVLRIRGGASSSQSRNRAFVRVVAPGEFRKGRAVSSPAGLGLLRVGQSVWRRARVRPRFCARLRPSTVRVR
jgi:hypothetical protein